jgi:CubicO group peptidase (beta-lactamase class C family)
VSGLSELSTLLVDAAARHRVPGAALTVRWRDEVSTVVTGRRRVPDGAGAAVAADTRFALGSVTKAFTATVALMLVADGDLELDGVVADHEPALKATPVGAATLRQLLSHTSGLPADGDVAPDTTPLRFLVALSGGSDPVGAPGEAFSYSNAGYVLVGHLITAVTGMSWWEAVDTMLLTPLGVRTGFVVAEPGGRAEPVFGHVISAVDGRPRPVAQVLDPLRAPAGGLALSSADLAAFGALHLPGPSAGLLSTQMLAEQRTPLPGCEPWGLADGWGLGLAAFGPADRPWVGHDGTADGATAHLRIDPAGGTVVALTTNASTGDALWRELADRLRELGLPLPAAPAVRSAPPATVADTDPCLGRYRNGDTEYLVGPGERELSLTVDGVAVATLAVRADLAFTMHDAVSGGPPHHGRFLPDPSTGRVQRLQVTGRTALRADADQPTPVSLPH